MASSTRPRSSAAKPRWKSRAVLRDVEAGSSVDCAHCGERVKFQAKVRNRQVICNVYVRGVWDRVDHYHAECYDLAGEPHGPIVGPLDQRKSPSPAATVSA
jgi:hypothetical protein